MKETLKLEVQIIDHLNDIDIELYHIAVYRQGEAQRPVHEVEFATKAELDNLLYRLHQFSLIQDSWFDVNTGQSSFNVILSQEDQNSLWPYLVA